MEKVRPWCGQPSDRGRLKNRTEHDLLYILTDPEKCRRSQETMKTRTERETDQRWHADSGLESTVACSGLHVTKRGLYKKGKGKGSPYSITERMVPQLIPVLGSQPAGDVSHKPRGRLSLLSARPAVTPATVKIAATNFAAW